MRQKSSSKTNLSVKTDALSVVSLVLLKQCTTKISRVLFGCFCGVIYTLQHSFQLEHSVSEQNMLMVCSSVFLYITYKKSDPKGFILSHSLFTGTFVPVQSITQAYTHYL